MDLRKVQMGIFPNLSRLSKIYPTFYHDTCLWRGGLPTLYHVSWECGRKPENIKTFLGKIFVNSLEQWEAQLASLEVTLGERKKPVGPWTWGLTQRAAEFHFF